MIPIERMLQKFYICYLHIMVTVVVATLLRVLLRYIYQKWKILCVKCSRAHEYCLNR